MLTAASICTPLHLHPSVQMEWHAGNMLSQTVYTLLYVHCLPDLNPDFLPRQLRTAADPLRPPELVTIVLRAAVFGLLKSCDLSWRELSKGRVYDVSLYHRDALYDTQSVLYRMRTGTARNVKFLCWSTSTWISSSSGWSSHVTGSIVLHFLTEILNRCVIGLSCGWLVFP